MSRLLFERLCRGAALTSLVAALLLSWRAAASRDVPAARRVLVRVPDSLAVAPDGDVLDTLRAALVRRERITRAPAPDASGDGDTLWVPLPAVPSPAVRAALGSLRAQGVPLVWADSTGARGLAGAVVRPPSPGAPLDVRVAAGRGGALRLRDGGGLLDSVPDPAPVVTWRLRSAAAPLTVLQGANRLPLAVPDSSPARRLLVLAHPGWEAKFVVAALEEAGWPVDGSLRVSPTGSVTIGAPQRLDTARYAAVVVLDSVAVDGAAIAQFVARGGGLVLGGDALRLPALAPLRPARPLALRGAIAGGLLTEEPRSGLEAWELAVDADAVVLAEDHGDHGHEEPALVARRHGAGRVIAMPYRESWRWRMQGDDDGMSAHRAWWHAAVVAAVGAARAAEPSSPVLDGGPGVAAPYADLVARAGAAEIPPEGEAGRIADDGRPSASDIPLGDRPWLLLFVALAALLAEWASRRLRGAR